MSAQGFAAARAGHPGVLRPPRHARGYSPGMRTFAVSDVARAAGPRAELDRTVAITSLMGAPSPTRGEARSFGRPPRPPAARVEQVYASAARLVACTDVSPLVQMAHDAFYEHRPIALSPDALWFTIAQGFATHVNANVETLRARFVRHAGKAKLVVERPDFLLGQPNPWPEAFAAFSDQIAGHVGKLRDLVVADFSTTGPLERAATEVLLMDTFQGYFEYEMMCGCGIPQITLRGTPDDWRSVRRRAQHLSEYGLEDWIGALLPVLDRIVATAEGADDAPFWRSFFHYQSGSMGSALTGWINVLFPYLVDWHSKGPVPNPHMAHWQANFARTSRDWRDTPGPSLSALPSGLASAPVLVTDVRTRDRHPMRFVAGLFGVIEEADGTLAPEFGWAVTHDAAAAPA